jgi:hypothetical protein
MTSRSVFALKARRRCKRFVRADGPVRCIPGDTRVDARIYLRRTELTMKRAERVSDVSCTVLFLSSAVICPAALAKI